MQARTINTEQIWQSPDGTRKIWEVTLKTDAGEHRIKTYSPKIGQLGFEGDVQSYRNPRGDRFVKQLLPAKKEAATASGYSRDDNAIKAQWAIGQAINLASVKMDKSEITLPLIEKYARELFATVSRVKGEPFTDAHAAEAEKHIQSFTQAAAF